MLAVVLALLASASWGAADFTGGLKSRVVPTGVVLLFVEGVGLLVVLAYVAARAEPPPGGEPVALSLAAGACGVTALFCFYRALAIGTMSVVAPVSACGVALPVAVGLATGDLPSALTAAGMVLTVVGVVVASRAGDHDDDAQRSASRQSILLALVAALGFGAFFALSDPAADASVPWLLVFSRVLAVVVLGAWALRTRPGLPRTVDALPLVLAGVLDMTATALYALANREGELAIVSVVGSLYPVVTVLLARAVLHERVQRTQGAGVLLALTGVLLIVAGR